MTRAVSLLAVCGSMRRDSLNGRLLRGLAGRLGTAGAHVDLVSLRDYPMPLYDGDLEEDTGVPAGALALRREIMEHDGLVIAGPEHNGSVSALLKNTLDWCSRPGDGAVGLAAFRTKPVLIAATSVSPFGGVRGLGHLRAMLGKMGCLVYPDDLAIPDGRNALSPEGALAVAAQQQAADVLCGGFVGFVRQMTVTAP